MIEVSWPSLKSFLQSRSIAAQWIDLGDNYHVVGVDGPFLLSCLLARNESEETIDFETNFKDLGNTKVSLTDSDNAQIIKSKTTRAGWHFEPRSIDFTAGVAGSLYNRKHDGNTIDSGTDYGDAALFFYDASGVAITQNGETLAEWQTRLDAQCVRTQIDWQPTYEMDIIGANVSILNAPEGTDRAYLWVIIAPEIPAEYGGQVPFLSGGWNARHFKSTPTTYLDGRGVYSMAYDPVYNSNKLRVIVKHQLNCRMELQFVAEHFKA